MIVPTEWHHRVAECAPVLKQFVRDINGSWEGRAAGIDGGLAHRWIDGLDVICVRAVGVVGEFREGKLADVSYVPSERPPVQIIYDVLEDDASPKPSLYRLNAELSVALECDADLILLDGSVVPKKSDRMSDQLYDELLKKYKKLYARGVAGIVEDSRARTFTHNFDIAVPDVIALDRIMTAGQRTVERAYSQSPTDHPVLRDLGRWGKEIRIFYVKLSAYDLPLRVECVGLDASELAAALCIMRGHPMYTLPSVLVEADMRARIRPNELQFIGTKRRDRRLWK